METIIYSLKSTTLCIMLGAAAGAMTACEGAVEEQPPTDIPEGTVGNAGEVAEHPGYVMCETDLPLSLIHTCRGRRAALRGSRRTTSAHKMMLTNAVLAPA